jgi:hypothetical protein
VKRKLVRLTGVVLGVIAIMLSMAPASSGTAALAPCEDGAYHLNASRWRGTLEWRFQASSTPKNLGKAAVERALKRAARNVVTGRNPCGLSDRISATQRYLGRTAGRPDIRANGTCRARDGHNEVGFGTLPVGAMALTCFWVSGRSTLESDIMLNKADYRWITRVETGCVAEWDVEGVATHEFGHAFGLDHVAEGLHGNLTMSPFIQACQNGEATLGLGDVRGLRAKY